MGVPRLLEILERRKTRATFLFTLGPDRSGPDVKRLLSGPVVGGLSARARYGASHLLYGTLLPAPDIGRKCRGILRGVRDGGWETGLRAFDSGAWMRHAASATAEWTERALERGMDRYNEIFGALPEVHGAPCWHMNSHALRLEQRWGFAFASDSRGSHPYIPVQRGEIVLCAQVPTTLPTLEELLGDGHTPEHAAARLLVHTQPADRNHVFALYADTAGLAMASTFEHLLAKWEEQGFELCALGDLFHDIASDALPRHEVLHEAPARGSGTVMRQGEEFLGEWGQWHAPGNP